MTDITLSAPRSAAHPATDALPCAEQMRVRGTVQGVGFRPHVWRIANELGIRGSVLNDAQGVLITAIAPRAALDRLAHRLRDEAPALALVEAVERAAAALPDAVPAGFSIEASRGGAAMTAVAADAAICAACVAEMLDPRNRRFRYPLTHCTHCGPRLSFVTGVPYDRARTTMAGFPMCPACRREYDAPSDRRFHAQPIACPACGPRVQLKHPDGRAFAPDFACLDDCDAASTLLARGRIVAIKGLGGYQLACDATQDGAVSRLRALKRRERKPFALMAASVEAVRAWCEVGEAEAQALQSAAAPIVLLPRRAVRPGAMRIAEAVTPGLTTLGFMLPSTGVHHLVLLRMAARPIVLTSGNLSDEPQAITLDELARRFDDGVDFVLDHDRPIARRIDDSVVRIVDGAPAVLRRARGHAPAPIALPAGFAPAPDVLAYGGELKNTFCMSRDGQAVLSQHIGDLAEAATRADWQQALQDLQGFFHFTPQVHACDAHPDYVSTQVAHACAARNGGAAVEVLHHHAHVASCLVDNGWPLHAGPVLGVALDGLGCGEGGQLWGGEFAIADYRRFERRGTFKPVPLLGGEAAVREPWRNTYAHLMAAMKWPAFAMNCAGLELHAFLAGKPRELLDVMLARQLNSPPASSCGRLFDAVAAALGLCRERAAYEGQGAVELEACVDHDVLRFEDEALGYPFAIVPLEGSPSPEGLACIEPLPMWRALLADLARATPLPTMAARFHEGLARVIVGMVDKIARLHDAQGAGRPLRHVALSGGVFQNRVLLERVGDRLRGRGYTVLMHRRVPCNDGGLALGQAAVAAARALQPLHPRPLEAVPCA